MKTTLLLLALSACFTLAQGPLTPPLGVPAPSMKSLAQIEARTAIPPSPAVPTSGPHYLILSPGSYYLTGNITMASGDAIVINSDDVSIDLNGFTIKSIQTNGTSGSAINVTSDRSRITIKNGSIVSGTVVVTGATPVPLGFIHGIYSNTSIKQALISDLQVSGTSGSGILIDEGGIIERCTVSNCGNRGLSAAIVRDCSVTNCYGDGIDTENAMNCISSSVIGTGIYCYGNATNCKGFSSASAEVSAWGVFCSGTATSCQAYRPAGPSAGFAAIAISCTTLGGTWDSPSKHLGTP